MIRADLLHIPLVIIEAEGSNENTVSIIDVVTDKNEKDIESI